MKIVKDLLSDLEEFRTPVQMKDYFETKRTEILAHKELNDLARLKKDTFKNFLEAFYPLYLYSQSSYVPADAKVKVVIGNQGFDSIVMLSSGEQYKVEITEYIDGKAENDDAKLINERGYGGMKIGDTRDLENKALDYLDLVIQKARRKARKNYQGMTLIIVINTFEILDLKKFNLIVRKYCC
ncbi:hypothetical protein ACFFSY_01120 [Paenibacillus aurantiacus]|uniref:Uncharacterized protein n=1 Tax=Paenibacillus aurantiacus TaxID=1936118 RepID=A0ABV5KH30_9BACL